MSRYDRGVMRGCLYSITSKSGGQLHLVVSPGLWFLILATMLVFAPSRQLDQIAIAIVVNC